MVQSISNYGYGSIHARLLINSEHLLIPFLFRSWVLTANLSPVKSPSYDSLINKYEPHPSDVIAPVNLIKIETPAYANKLYSSMEI